VRRSPNREAVHWVYLLHAKPDPVGERQLLYVGMTGNVGNRLSQHFKEREWALLIGDIQLFAYSSRYKAEDAEQEFIRKFQPPFNDRHTAISVEGWSSEGGTKQTARQERILAAFNEWIPSFPVEEKAEVSEVWRRQKDLGQLGLTNFDDTLRQAFASAAAAGLNIEAVKNTIASAVGKAQDATEHQFDDLGNPLRGGFR